MPCGLPARLLISTSAHAAHQNGSVAFMVGVLSPEFGFPYTAVVPQSESLWAQVSFDPVISYASGSVPGPLGLAEPGMVVEAWADSIPRMTEFRNSAKNSESPPGE